MSELVEAMCAAAVADWEADGMSDRWREEWRSTMSAALDGLIAYLAVVA